MMTSIAVGLGYWLAGSLAFAVVFSIAKRCERSRLAWEWEAAQAQRAGMELAHAMAQALAAGLERAQPVPEVSEAQIAAAFSDIVRDYDAPLSRDEAERMQRLLAFGMVAPVMARAFYHPAPVQVMA